VRGREGAPDTAFFRAQAWSYLVELPEGAQTTADDDAPRFLVSAGNHFRPGELPLLDMYLTGVTLRIARDNVRGHIPDALELAGSGKVDPARVVSHVLDWEQLPEALPEKHLKPVFVRNGG
jgi:hypothetical protein